MAPDFFFQPFRSPARRPLCDGVHTQPAVGPNLNRRVLRQHLECLDQRPKLHTVVGRLWVVAVPFRLDLALFHPHHPPPPGPGFGTELPSVKTPEPGPS